MQIVGRVAAEIHQSLRKRLVVLLTCALALGSMSAAAQTAPASPIADSEQKLLRAATSGQTATVEGLLDPEFEWTNQAGLSRDRSETMHNLAMLAADTFGESGLQSYSYDHMVVTTGQRFGLRFMRVWVQRPEGWRLYAMIHTPGATGAPAPFSLPAGEKTADCENPCRTIPFNPSTTAQREMLDTFKRLKMDEWHPNPDDWAPWVLDDVYYVTSAGQLSKADRVNRLAQQKQSGAASLPGDPVQSMRIAEFGNSAVMVTRHSPFQGGKPYVSVRVWTLRDGKWRFANSQQTVIDAADASAPAAH